MREVVIFDIEASCEDHNKNPNYNMETIEIGAVKVSQGKIVDTFETFIMPEYVTDLTGYCTELTGITFADLKGAPKFAEAILDFEGFIYGHTIYSCGNFDKKFLTREIREKGYGLSHVLVSNAINSTHINLKSHFSNVTGKKKQGMIGMAKELGVKLTGANHRALSDAKNLANIYIEIENFREGRLRQTFTPKVMVRIIEGINNYHECNIRLTEEGYVDFNSQDDNDYPMSFLELLDAWKDVFSTDMSERSLNYIMKDELNILVHLSQYL